MTPTVGKKGGKPGLKVPFVFVRQLLLTRGFPLMHSSFRKGNRYAH